MIEAKNGPGLGSHSTCGGRRPTYSVQYRTWAGKIPAWYGGWVGGVHGENHCQLPGAGCKASILRLLSF